jgi:hypothetical protein
MPPGALCEIKKIRDRNSGTRDQDRLPILHPVAYVESLYKMIELA